MKGYDDMRRPRLSLSFSLPSSLGGPSHNPFDRNQPPILRRHGVGGESAGGWWFGLGPFAIPRPGPYRSE